MKLIYAIGWVNYIEVDMSAFVELVKKFYNTFEFHKPPNFNLKPPIVP